MTPQIKLLLGTLLLIGSLAGIGFGLIQPLLDEVNANTTKLSDLKIKVTDLTAQQTNLISEVRKYQQAQNIPQDVVVHPYKANALGQGLKEMLDTLINLASDNDTNLISLEPTNEEVANGTANSTSSAASVANANGLQAFKYTLIVRGNYQSVTNFLGSISQYKELIEVAKIKLENEGGPQRSGNNASSSGSSTSLNTAHLDPIRPIKLTLNLTLFLTPALS